VSESVHPDPGIAATEFSFSGLSLLAGSLDRQRILEAGAEAMELNLTPDLQARLDRLSTDTGRPASELLEDALAGYFHELSHVRETLDSRYDDLKTGRVKPISGAEVKKRLRARSAARRAGRQ
jgi:predicted DNA-binding protein